MRDVLANVQVLEKLLVHPRVHPRLFASGLVYLLGVLANHRRKRELV